MSLAIPGPSQAGLFKPGYTRYVINLFERSDDRNSCDAGYQRDMSTIFVTKAHIHMIC